MERINPGLAPVCAVVLTLLAAFGPRTARAANERSFCLNRLYQISLALEDYRETFGTYPTDICDAKGRPLLSWRVKLLPYLSEPFLYQQIRLDEAWDSPNNRKVLEETPRSYWCGSCEAEQGRTCYLIPRAEETPLPRDSAHGWREIRKDRSTTVILVEVDKEHAVWWTKPADLDYDPHSPRRGLGRHHGGNFRAHRRGSFALFADGRVRLIHEGVDDETLRSLMAAEGTRPVRFDYPWYLTIWEPALAAILVPALLMALWAILGSVPVARRMFHCRRISPGEKLWFVAGVQQLTFLIMVVTTYQYQWLPSLYGRDVQHLRFWSTPSLVATVAAAFAVGVYGRLRAWQLGFGCALVLFFLATKNSITPYQHRPVEECFMTASSPGVWGLVRTGAALLTLMRVQPAAWRGRTLRHWAGIGTCFLPFVWFWICWARGWVAWREWWVRMLD